MMSKVIPKAWQPLSSREKAMLPRQLLNITAVSLMGVRESPRHSLFKSVSDMSTMSRRLIQHSPTDGEVKRLLCVGGGSAFCSHVGSLDKAAKPRDDNTPRRNLGVENLPVS